MPNPSKDLRPQGRGRLGAGVHSLGGNGEEGWDDELWEGEPGEWGQRLEYKIIRQ